jgi:zinc protease
VRTLTQILIGGLGTHPSDPDHVALSVGNTIFGGTFTARLMNEVRSKRGWSYGAYSSLPYDRRRQSFSMWVFPKATDAAACIELELQLLEKWRNKGVTKKELSWAKRFLIRSHAFTVDTPSKRVGLQLDSELYQLPEGYYDNYLEHVRSVTLEQVNAAIQTRISADDLLVTVVGTEKDVGEAVRKAIPGLSNSEVVPFDAN